MRAEAMDAHSLAFVAGGIEISVEDVAHALAVHDGRGEDMDNEGAKAIRMQDARDLLDRAFRYARDRRQVTR
jgi:hypothetical protein